jgi:hypothetical protein
MGKCRIGEKANVLQEKVMMIGLFPNWYVGGSRSWTIWDVKLTKNLLHSEVEIVSSSRL